MSNHGGSDDARLAGVHAEQARILRALADRIGRGEPVLSTDVFQQVADDLELRIDTAAIADAWTNEPEAPAVFSSKPPGAHRAASTPHEIRIFQSAQQALDAIEGPDRELVRTHLDGLADDALPRGVAALPCAQHGTHLGLRVGRHRILYRVRSGGLLVVAITTS